MRLWPKSLKWRAIVLTLIVTASSCGVTCLLNPSMVDEWVFTARVWMRNQLERQERIDRLKESEHASLRDLARGEFGRGSTADEWFAKHPPTWCVRHDNYITAYYARDEEIILEVIAQDGELIHAHIGYTYYDFFTFRTKADQNAHADSLTRWVRFNNLTLPGVVGVAAAVPRHFPPPTGD